MKYRPYGGTGWQVSTVGFGAWAIGADWGHVSESDALDALHKSIDLGVNFIDTADVKEIAAANELGLVDGVTTNPTLLSREEGDPREILREITKIVEGPVSAEVTALDAEGMGGIVDFADQDALVPVLGKMLCDGFDIVHHAHVECRRPVTVRLARHRVPVVFRLVVDEHRFFTRCADDVGERQVD